MSHTHFETISADRCVICRLLREEPMKEDWFEDRSEVAVFAHVLINAGHLPTKKDVVDFFATAERWTDEHDRWIAAGRPDEFDFEADALARADTLRAAQDAGGFES